MASGNRGKLREIARLLADFECTVVPQSELGVSDADETGDTFEENALIKARHAATTTGLPAIAADSGLAVAALDGRPGVFSARYSGADATDDENIDLLLQELEHVPDANRGATFHCVACFVAPGDTDVLLAKGTWRGHIAHERQGDGGFGYDPVFIDTELGIAAANLSADDKNSRSHRGKALAELVTLLRDR